MTEEPLLPNTLSQAEMELLEHLKTNYMGFGWEELVAAGFEPNATRAVLKGLRTLKLVSTRGSGSLTRYVAVGASR